jgi:hypothetical protein
MKLRMRLRLSLVCKGYPKQWFVAEVKGDHAVKYPKKPSWVTL